MKERHFSRSRTSEGFVMVWAALMLTLLLAFSGFAVDVGNWYLHINRVQRAADAAALAGDVYLPSNLALAKDTARKSLLSNGVPPELAATASIDLVPGQKNQLEVRVKTVVKNTFLQLIGIRKEMTFTRKAVASHREAITLGAASNVLGGFEPGPDPWLGTDAASDAGYWLNISGGGTGKSRGDRFTSAVCLTSPAPDNCSGSKNTEYQPEGYEFRVTAERGATAPFLSIQAYDPAFVETGYSTDPDIQCPAAPSAYKNPCPGDHAYGQDGAGMPPTNTRYEVWTDEEDSKPVANCIPKTFPGFTGDIAKELSFNAQFRTYFHQWATICTFPVDTSKTTSYLVKVKTDKNARGMNRFVLRAGMFSDAAAKNRNKASTQTKVRISAVDILPIYSNYDALDPSTISLARIPSTTAGEVVHLELYDYGESVLSNSPVAVGLSGSGDMSSSPVGWDCKLSGPPLLKLSKCAFKISNSQEVDGRVLKIDLPVPANYKCNDLDPSGCWLRVSTLYASAADDASTWSVKKDGQPLRLVR